MSEFFAQYGDLLIKNTWVTIYVTTLSTFFSYVFGVPLGVLLVITQPHGIWAHKTLNSVLGWIVNIGRSIPFIILMVALMPLTRLVMGIAIGPNAAILPLVIAATPFVARLVESSLQEVDAGVIEVAQSTGSTIGQIVWKVILPESLPSMVLGASITFITLLGYMAMAGAIGAGGLGDVAIRYGYYKYQTDIMIATIIILIILVAVIQLLGNGISRKIDRRIKK
ncbi:MAG: ABC-type metal ion transport system, permease component [Bacillota bacterium]|jgi:D-methionine transport system permease protein|nr:ABC-type metal ion transport system, permease component [Bacillota bacterium]